MTSNAVVAPYLAFNRVAFVLDARPGSVVDHQADETVYPENGRMRMSVLGHVALRF